MLQIRQNSQKSNSKITPFWSQNRQNSQKNRTIISHPSTLKFVKIAKNRLRSSLPSSAITFVKVAKHGTRGSFFSGR